MTPITHRLRWLGLLSLLVLATCSASAVTLSPAETRGKQIYTTGTSASGAALEAFIGQSSVALPASAIPCAGCHGPDGKGRPEGGIVPTDITWQRLSKPYGVVSASGYRQHPAYDEVSLARAITGGVDPSNNAFDPSMPRFQMSAGDMADLLAYLKRLENDLDPGLDDETISIGTVMPRHGAMAAAAEAMIAVLVGYFGELNEQGGIYNRRIELIVARAGGPSDALDKARALVESQQIFALVGAVTAGIEADFEALVEAHKVPFVGPFTPSPPHDASGLRRQTFYLFGGSRIQGLALMEYATSRLMSPGQRGVVVYPQGPVAEEAAEAMLRQALNRGRTGLARVAYPRGDIDADALAVRLEAAGTRALFFLGSGAEFALLAAAADRIAWAPYTLLLGARAGQAALAAPPSFGGRLFVAYPTSPSDHTKQGLAAFGEFHRRLGLSKQHLGAQIAAYTAAKLLREGLSSVGRTLTRERLVGALERLYKYATGLTPPLSFGANRHVGARGAHIVGVDLAQRRFEQGSTWITP
jgi:ABC-type branched-subunit amino acid transport system substrate-binding protein